MKLGRWAPLLATFALVLAASPAVAKSLIMAISEGSSGGTDHARVIAKYQGLAETLGTAIGQPVSVVFIREFSALEDGLKNRRFDLAMARPSDYPARAMRDHGYRYVATSKPDGQCLIIVPKDSAYATLADIRGKRIVLPSPAAYMSRLCTAELRDRAIDLGKEKVERVKEQGAVPFYLSNKFGDVGGIASYSSEAKTLDKSGYRVLHASAPQPYFPLISKDSLTATQIQAMQKALLTLQDTSEGRAVLKSIGIEGFESGSEDRLKALLPWLEK